MANEMLYFPFMHPNEHWLRAALLFTDRVYTIVPKQRQGLDWLERDTREIVDRLSDVAPKPRQGEDECVLAQVDPHMDDIIDTGSTSLTDEVKRYYEANREAGAFPETHVNDYLSLAAGKLPEDLLQWLDDKGLYVWIEEDPDSGRIHPNIGNYFMNRLASIIADKYRVPATTDRKNDYACNALRGIDRPPNIEGDIALLSWCLSIMVPQEITQLDANTYLDVRQHYQEIAVDVLATMANVTALHRIDQADTLGDLIADLEHAQRAVDQGIQGFIDARDDFEANRLKRVTYAGLIETAKAVPIGGPAVGIVERVVDEARRRPDVPLTNSKVVYANLADQHLRVLKLAEPVCNQLDAV